MTASSREYRVPFARRGSVLGEAEAEAVAALVLGDDSLTSGQIREDFERRFAGFVGCRHALSVTSGTVALELAIGLLDLEPGDEVVATPQTFQATVQPLLDTPATVRFCDVDAGTLNLDPDKLAELLTERTRAVVLVHYGGRPADMDRILALTRPRGIVVVEDCAHALGAAAHGRRPGALADIGCFSFHASKNITTLGEGGMITCDRDDWAERVDRRRSNAVDGDFVATAAEAERPALLRHMVWAAHAYGQSCKTVRRAGTNATLSEAAAAVGLVQLDRLPALTARRREIASRLDEVVASHDWLRPTRAEPGVTDAHHLYTFFIERRGLREAFVDAVRRRSVEVQLRYFPQHLMPEWRAGGGHGPGECPVAENLWFEAHMNLPCHPALDDAQLEHLVTALDEAAVETGRLVPNRKEVSSCPSSM